MSYTVIFVDARGPAVLGKFDDKGACRRAWKSCSEGAGIVGPDGAVLEFRGGTSKLAETKLKTYAEHLRRQGGIAGDIATAIPPRAPAPAAVEPDDEDDEPDATTYTRVERIEQVDAMVARDDERAAARESGASAELVAAEHTRAAEAFRAVVEQAREAARAVDPRPAEVTHAVSPVTGAVVQGDDTERLQPAAAPARCAARGCTSERAGQRCDSSPEVAGLCRAHRLRASDRAKRWELTLAAAAQTLVDGLSERPASSPPSQRGANLRGRGATKPAPPARRVAPAPKPRRAAAPATSLAAGLAYARRCAAVVEALGGTERAEALVALVAEHGGADAVTVALAELATLARAA